MDKLDELRPIDCRFILQNESETLQLLSPTPNPFPSIPLRCIERDSVWWLQARPRSVLEKLGVHPLMQVARNPA